MRICVDCNELRDVHSHNRCEQCYQRYNRKQRKLKAGKKECSCGCGNLMDVLTTENKVQRFLPGHNLPKDAIGEKHPRWKGGRYQDKRDGYVYHKVYNHPFKNKNGQVPEHKLVLETYYSKKFGIPIFIFPLLEVDHLNNIKDDNRIENLKIRTKREHSRRHGIDRGGINTPRVS